LDPVPTGRTEKPFFAGVALRVFIGKIDVLTPKLEEKEAKKASFFPILAIFDQK
jgi:hypothetical protein